MNLIYALPGNETFAAALATALSATPASLKVHRFPDGENLVQVEPPVQNSQAILICTLDHPDQKIVPLIMAAATLRELGATRIGLIAPYLAYMRQDERFAPGQAVSSKPFAQLLSRWFDWLITVDPHLHRYQHLSEIYSLDAHVVRAAPKLAAWIKQHIDNPLIIGPDEESAQWTSDVAHHIGAPSIVLNKQRFGDRDVRVSIPDMKLWHKHTPVLVDDIISTGHTMMAALPHLCSAGIHKPICIGVHGLFTDGALEGLRQAGATRIVSTNTIPNATSMIDISSDIATAVARL